MPNPFVNDGKVRSFVRRTLAKIQASVSVLGAGEIMTDEQGNIYVGDGSTVIQSLRRLLRINEANVVPSPGAGVDVGPALQAAFDAGRTVHLVPGAIYLLSTPIFLDAASNFARYRLYLHGATLKLDPALPKPSTWNTAIAAAPPTGFYSGTLRSGWTGGATVDTSTTSGATNAPMGARLVIHDGIVGSSGSLGSQAVCVVFGGAANTGTAGAANGLSHVTLTNAIAGISWSGYADGNFAEEVEIGSNPPSNSTRIIYQRDSGDKTRITRCKAFGGVLADLSGCTGFIIDGFVSGQIILSASMGRISGGHQEADEGASAVPRSILIDRSHVTIEDHFGRQANVATHYGIQINDTTTAPNYTASEVVIKGLRTDARFSATQTDVAKGPGLYITSLNTTGYVRVENSRGVVTIPGTSVGWQALHVDSADAGIQAAFAAGADHLAGGNWSLSYNGAWNVGPVSAATPLSRALKAPTLSAAVDTVVTTGGLTGGQVYEYVAAAKTAAGGGSYSALSSAVQVTAGANGVIDLGVINTSGAVTIAIWRKTGAGVAAGPDHYVEIGLPAYQTTWVDTGGNINGRAWQTASLPVPNTVKSTGCQYIDPRGARKAADQAFGTGTTGTNDSELAFPLAANCEYDFAASIVYDADTTGRAKFAFVVPSGAVIVFSQVGMANAVGGNSGSVSYAASSTSGSTAAFVGGAGIGTKIGWWARGTVKVGSTAGSLQLQAAQALAGGSGLTIYAGSSLSAQKIA
jgi:hypothetical protein